MYKIYINIVKITDILCNSAAAAVLFHFSFFSFSNFIWIPKMSLFRSLHLVYIDI